MTKREESSLMLFLVTITTHLALFPPMIHFYKRRCIFELCVSIFGFVASFMYHLCEDFNTAIFLSERQWHRLDNIGVITTLGMLNVIAAHFTNKSVEELFKYSIIFVTIIFQQKHPWDVRLTVAPLLLFFLIPVVNHCFIKRHAPPPVNKRFLYLGFGFLGMAIPFFVKGLDDRRDPFRLFHGLWHFFGGISYAFLMLMFSPPRTHTSNMKLLHEVLLGRESYI